MVTIYDIAKRASVSPMTVSRVINHTGNTRESTRKKVEKAIKELGYVPNAAARSLTSNQSNNLALLLPDISNPFFSKIARGAEDEAAKKGYRLLLSNTDESREKEVHYIDSVLSARVDGVLLAPTCDHSIKQIERLTAHKIPVVLIDRTIAAFNGDYVIGDSYIGSRRLMEHLISLGHERVAFINGPLSISTSRERKRGYCETLKLNELPVYDHYISEVDYNSESVADIIERLYALPKMKRPTAIFAANNLIAINTIRALKDMNLQVPEDVSIVCFDEVEPVVYFDPFFTVAAQPAQEFGRIGIQFLIEHVQQKMTTEARKVVLQPNIHIRKSTRVIKRSK
ncbi:LacI family DNA-binding transcriptional regulator [Halalkalibacter sp. AB-rgal2]|nr:LacI family transcriptional regulator [Halalkalibacter sp. APA_J-10(15)]